MTPSETTTLEAAAIRIGVGRSTVQRMIRRGELTALVTGRRVLVTCESIDRVIALRPTPPLAHPPGRCTAQFCGRVTCRQCNGPVGDGACQVTGELLHSVRNGPTAKVVLVVCVKYPGQAFYVSPRDLCGTRAVIGEAIEDDTPPIMRAIDNIDIQKLADTKRPQVAEMLDKVFNKANEQDSPAKLRVIEGGQSTPKAGGAA